MSSRFLLSVPLAVVAFGVLILATIGVAAAHPDDEMCEPWVQSINPVLCQQLADMDRGGRDVVNRDGLPSIDEQGNAGFWGTLAGNVLIGLDHILPGGLDHILFVLAVVMSIQNVRTLVILISMFTLAHSVSLALVAFGFPSPPSQFVELLIAASIVYVALENLIRKKKPRHRWFVIFLFGLLHGFGFASFFSDLDTPVATFVPAIIGFNFGVEVGQLCVVVVALIALTVLRHIGEAQQQPQKFVRPTQFATSALIACVGSWFIIERVFL
ncbi:MAG: HupE/UreJ family protein [Pseudomonadota bacterium]